jgi:hypothetical protein
MSKQKKTKSKKSFKNRKQVTKRAVPLKKNKQRKPGWLNKLYETPMHEEWNGHIESERYPSGFREDYSSQLPRIPQYYHEEPFASAVIDRYSPLPVLAKKDRQTPEVARLQNIKKQRKNTDTVPLNEHSGLMRYRDSLDAQRWLTIHDTLTNTEWEEAYDAGVLHPTYSSSATAGFSRYGRYGEGREEMKEAYGSGSREGQRLFGRAGRHSKRKRK